MKGTKLSRRGGGCVRRPTKRGTECAERVGWLHAAADTPGALSATGEAEIVPKVETS